MPKTSIVILDGHALNPGDLSWEPLKKFGALTVHTRTSQKQILQHAGGAEVLLLNKAILNKDHLEQLPLLKFISVMATGVNTVDLQATSKLGIAVSNVVGYSTFSVAQHTWALVLELTNRVGYHCPQVSNGQWSRSKDWSYWDFPLTELAHKKLGIVGLGNIGRQVAHIGIAFGMEVLAYHPTLKNFEGVHIVSLEHLFSQSDVVSLHCPLNDETRHLVNSKRLSAMKPSAILINTARGPLIEEQDLFRALTTGTIAAAGLDVLSEEPPALSHPLTTLSNCLITPHQAWASYESRKRLMEGTVLNVEAYIAGHPRNVVKA